MDSFGIDSSLGEVMFHFKYYNAGFEWSPRMDVAESGRNYVLLVELPGVSIHDIRVEVSDQK